MHLWHSSHSPESAEIKPPLPSGFTAWHLNSKNIFYYVFKTFSFFSEIYHSHNKKKKKHQTTLTQKHHRQEWEGWLKAEQGCWEMLEVNTSPQGSSVGIFQALGYSNSLKIFREQAQTILIRNLLSLTFITAAQTHKFRVHILALLQTLPYLYFSSQQ